MRTVVIAAQSLDGFITRHDEPGLGPDLSLALQIRRDEGPGGDVAGADILFQGQVDEAVKMGRIEQVIHARIPVGRCRGGPGCPPSAPASGCVSPFEAELEALCGRHAERRMSDAEREELRAAHQACEEARSAGDADRYYHLNEHFHQVGAAAAQRDIDQCMQQAAQAGAVIFPPVPAFYAQPASLDELVTHLAGRMLLRLGIENESYRRWEGDAPTTPARG